MVIFYIWAIAISVVVAALFRFAFESRKTGVWALIVCVLISVVIGEWYRATFYQDAILRDKINITDLREGLPADDVAFYDASSGPIPII